MAQVRYKAAKDRGAFIEGEDKNGQPRCVWTTGKIATTQETVRGAKLAGDKNVSPEEASRLENLFKNLGWSFQLDQKKKALLVSISAGSFRMCVCA